MLILSEVFIQAIKLVPLAINGTEQARNHLYKTF